MHRSEGLFGYFPTYTLGNVYAGCLHEALRKAVPDLDDPHYALFVFLQDIVRANVSSDLGPIIAGVVGESARNENLAEGFRSFWADRRSKAAGLVRRILPTDSSYNT